MTPHSHTDAHGEARGKKDQRGEAGPRGKNKARGEGQKEEGGGRAKQASLPSPKEERGIPLPFAVCQASPRVLF